MIYTKSMKDWDSLSGSGYSKRFCECDPATIALISAVAAGTTAVGTAATVGSQIFGGSPSTPSPPQPFTPPDVGGAPAGPTDAQKVSRVGSQLSQTIPNLAATGGGGLSPQFIASQASEQAGFPGMGMNPEIMAMVNQMIGRG